MICTFVPVSVTYKIRLNTLYVIELSDKAFGADFTRTSLFQYFPVADRNDRIGYLSCDIKLMKGHEYSNVFLPGKSPDLAQQIYLVSDIKI